MRHTFAECPTPLHTALSHTSRISVNIRSFQAKFVSKHTSALTNGQLASVFSCVSVFYGKGDFLHSTVPRVLGALL